MVPVVLLGKSGLFTRVNIQGKVRSVFPSTAWSTLACSSCTRCVCQRRCENCFIEILPFIFPVLQWVCPPSYALLTALMYQKRPGPCLSGPNGAAVVQERRSELGMAYLTRVKYGGHFYKSPWCDPSHAWPFREKGRHVQKRVHKKRCTTFICGGWHLDGFIQHLTKLSRRDTE